MLLMVVQAAAVVGRVMVRVPSKGVRIRVQTASVLELAIASASIEDTLRVVPAGRRMSSVLV
jgi:hypothetical protein